MTCMRLGIKTLWIMVVVLTVGLFGGGGRTTLAAQPQSSTTVITFNIAEAIEVLQWPDVMFTLAEAALPGVPVVSPPLSITVRSNVPWGVMLRSNRPDGLLAEYELGIGDFAVDGVTVGPLEASTSPNGPWQELNDVGILVVSSQAPTGETAESVEMYLRVVPDFDWPRLPSGRDYRAAVTFTVGVGF